MRIDETPNSRPEASSQLGSISLAMPLGASSSGLETAPAGLTITEDSGATRSASSTLIIPGPGILEPRVSAPSTQRPAPSVSHITPQQLQFLLRVTPPALQSERDSSVPACVTIAQAILESATAAGWGSSSLFRLANNPFGIKYCHRVIGPSDHRIIGGVEEQSTDEPIPPDYGHFDAQTWEIENGQKKVIMAQFQRFPNLAAAFTAHARLLCGPRYRPAFDVRHDWKQFAERLGPKSSPLDLEHCGYSTNPSYSAELIKLVNLYRLNDPRAVQWYATGQDPGNQAIDSSDHRAIGSLRDLAIK